MKRSKITGIIGTLVLHVLVLLLLFLLTLTKPDVQEEGGVPVMLGNTEQAAGDADPYTMTEVDVMPQPQVAEPEPESVPAEPEVKQPLITQTDEPSVQVKKEEPKKEKKPVKKTEKKNPQKDPDKKVEPEKKPEKTEAEKRAEAERLAAQAAASKIAGAFGKGSKMGSKGNAETGTGLQGSTAGNSDAGKTTGVGGYGTFDLNGRSLGEGDYLSRCIMCKMKVVL